MRIEQLKKGFITMLLLILCVPVISHTLFHEFTHTLIQYCNEDDTASDRHCNCSCNNLLDHSHDGDGHSKSTDESCNVETEFTNREEQTSLLTQKLYNQNAGTLLCILTETLSITDRIESGNSILTPFDSSSITCRALLLSTPFRAPPISI